MNIFDDKTSSIYYYARISLIFTIGIGILSAIISSTVTTIMASVLNLYLPYIIIRPPWIVLHVKYTISFIFALLWFLFSIALSLNWIHELSQITGEIIAVISIVGIAIIPGFMNAFMLSSLFLDLRPSRKPNNKYPPITILIAAYNESRSIKSTIESIAKQNYQNTIRAIVINDGSSDTTGLIVRSLLEQYSWLHLIDLERNGGKSRALNHGLELVETDLVITIDGDSYLLSNAVTNIVERYWSDPPQTAAIAGTVLVRNSRVNWLTKTQEWDYFHGIASVKRIQSMYHGTLVAQGAFSLYDTRIIKSLGGWPEKLGEDIVLSWAILNSNYRIGFAEDAILFTNVPDNMKQFINQRVRWSRGLIEAFKSYWPLLFKKRMTTMYIWWNLLFFYLDLIYTLVFMPGMILAFFGYYWIAGPMTLALLPVVLLVNYTMYLNQNKIFAANNLKVRKNPLGFIIYILFYSMILQPSCVYGYIKEIIWSKNKSWGTK